MKFVNLYISFGYIFLNMHHLHVVTEFINQNYSDYIITSAKILDWACMYAI